MTVCKYLLLLLLGAASSPVLALNIFACEPEWQALAQELAGEQATIVTATSARQDPHHVQARPSLISAVRRADLVICTGAGLEAGWLPVLLAKGSNPRVQQAPGLFLASQHVALLDRPATPDRADGDVHAEGNPHIQLDPRRILSIADALSQRLQQLDPDHADHYRQRHTAFAAQWQANLARWQTQAAALRGVPVIVHHRSWVYLLDWLGMRQVGELEPKPGLPPTPAHLATLTDTARDQGVQRILYTHYNGSKAAEWLASHAGACAVLLPFTVDQNGEPGSLGALFDSLVNALLNQPECTHD